MSAFLVDKTPGRATVPMNPFALIGPLVRVVQRLLRPARSAAKAWYAVIRLRAIFFLGFWFVSQLASGITTLNGNTRGVAWWAHIGGFAAGVGYTVLRYRYLKEKRGRKAN